MDSRTIFGHVLIPHPCAGLHMGDLYEAPAWISQTPLDRASAYSLVSSMQEHGANYGILTENNTGPLTVHRSLDDLRSFMGVDKIKDDFDVYDVVMSDDRTAMAFQFPTIPMITGSYDRPSKPREEMSEEENIDFLMPFLSILVGPKSQTPVRHLSYPQARGLALAMGLDLPNFMDFMLTLSVLMSDPLVFSVSPKDLNFRKYVHCSIGEKETKLVGVWDPRYLDEVNGTRHWMGNGPKWLRRDIALERNKMGILRRLAVKYLQKSNFTPTFLVTCGSHLSFNPDDFLWPSCIRGTDSPSGLAYKGQTPSLHKSYCIGMVCAGNLQYSRETHPWLFGNTHEV